MKIIPWDEFQRQQRGEYQLTIVPDELRLGDLVTQIEAKVPPLDFPDRGFRVNSFDDKQWLIQRCKRVVIDLEHSLNRRVEGIDATLSVGILPPLPESMDGLRHHGMTAKRIVEAWPVYRRLWQVAQAQVLSFHRHGRIDLVDIEDAIGALVDAMPQHLSAMMWLMRIKEPARYPFQHGVNTAILAAAFCHVMKWDSDIAEAAATSGLVHDLGMMRVSVDVLRKKGPLSDAERDHIKLHTRIGFELLSQVDGLPEVSALTALCHHERPDGNGYPEGLTQKGIPAMARLISILSAYDAMTTTHHHHRARSHQQALGELWRMKGQQFDEDLADAFARFMGWAPPGVLLLLPQGGMAVSLHTVSGASRPIVQVLGRRGKDIEMKAAFDLAGSRGGSNHGVLLPDGSNSINHAELTRLLPAALRRARIRTRIPAAPKATKPTRERRKRERMNAPRGTRILVVDDSRTIRLALTTMLEDNHYEVFEAKTAQEGMALAEQVQPRLIFLDIILPDMTGFRVLKRLRAVESVKDTPVVMMSGDADASQKVFLKRVGADDFIDKPFGRLEVFSAIERLIRADALKLRIGD